MSQAPLPVLYREHMLLNASFEEAEDGIPPRPATYPGSESLSHVRRGAFLADLTGATYKLLGGTAADSLAQAAFAGRKLAVGECGFECVLTGDASVASVPFVARTGSTEYVVLDPTDRGETLSTWLGFLAKVEQGGYAPYAGTTLEDASQMLVPLLLVGASARRVLSDYVKSASDLPAAGRVAQIRLDAILCVVTALSLPQHDIPCYLVFVPRAQAVTLWRSFLSFQEVSPAGTVLLEQLMDAGLPWAHALLQEGRVTFGEKDLRSWGLARDASDFVGARALLS